MNTIFKSDIVKAVEVGSVQHTLAIKLEKKTLQESPKI